VQIECFKHTNVRSFAKQSQAPSAVTETHFENLNCTFTYLLSLNLLIDSNQWQSESDLHIPTVVRALSWEITATYSIQQKWFKYLRFDYFAYQLN